jgi:hypothetical protein
MDVTPHLVTGAALGARVKRPGAAILCAIVSHFVLDAIPHFHVAWGEGRAVLEAIDVGLGLLLTGVIAWRLRRMWPFVTAVIAVLPDAPGLRQYWGLPMSHLLPHPTWDPPWGIATQVLVTGAALLWGVRADWKRVASPRRWVPTFWRAHAARPAPSAIPPILLTTRPRPHHHRPGRR